MATRKWFVVEGEDEMGPLGPNGLRRLLTRGEILPGTMLRREDLTIRIRADSVRGLFDAPAADAQPQVLGPFTSLRVMGWLAFGLMLVWVAVGVLGVFTALGQRERAVAGMDTMPTPGADPGKDLLSAGAPFLGLGAPLAVSLFLVTGVLFTWWLWNARMNLRSLITAHIRFAANWTIACWFVPLLNLIRPYQVLEEVDRLSAEAAADGDASVRANSALLLPWWLATLLMAALATAYKLHPATTVAEIADATRWHLATAVVVSIAAALGAIVFLRITRLQEAAHDEHPEPVKLQHRFGRRAEGAANV